MSPTEVIEMQIRRAGPADYHSLEALTREEGWNYSLEDFADLDRTGCGKTLVAELDGRIMGIITLMDYGEVGWISNMLVEAGHRGRQYGVALLREAVRQLGEKKTIALFAYEDAVGFYTREGFNLEGSYALVRYLGGQGGACGSSTPSIEDVGAMDRRAFSMRRKELLETLAARGRLLSPASGHGFALIRPDPLEPMVGPVVCDDASAGSGLLYASFRELGAGAMAVMVGEPRAGFEVVERVRRLYLGEPPQTDTSMAIAFAGLEFG